MSRGSPFRIPPTAQSRVAPHDGSWVDERPRPSAVVDELLDRDTAWPLHAHASHELLWNTTGASTVSADRRVWSITPATGLWMPAGIAHSAFAVAGTRYRAAYFPEPFSDRPVAVELSPLLLLLLGRLSDRRLPAASRELTERMVMDVLAPAEQSLFVREPDHPLLRPIVAAVESDPGDRRTLDDWANELGVSTRTIARAFRVEVGQSFTAWVASVRAQRAIVALTRGDTIEQVASALGYGSVSSFATAFRRTTGMTPGRVR